MKDCGVWGVLWFLVTISMMFAQGAAELCNQAQSKCVSRAGCSMALHNYFFNCGEVIHGEIDICPARCRKALVSLLSTEDQEGEAFMECDCNGNSFCHTHKLRMEICSKDVLSAMKSVNDDSTDISCSLAELICRADTSCLTALQYFNHHCAKLHMGEKCSARCNNSLSILFRQRKARKLRTCICDGTESYPCQSVQENIERLCFQNESRKRGRHRHHGHHHHNHTRNADETGTEQVPPVQDNPVELDCSNTSSNLQMQCSDGVRQAYTIPVLLLTFMLTLTLIFSRRTVLMCSSSSR